MSAVKIVEFLQQRLPPKDDIEWPRWIPIGMTVLAVGAAGVAIVQRDPVWPPGIGDLLGVIAIAAWAYCLLGQPRVLWFGLVTYGSVVGVMVVDPVRLDFAPMVLTLLIGQLAAATAARLSAGFAVASGAALVVLDVVTVFDGSAFWIVAIAVAWDVGFIFQSQMRMLEQERATAAARAEQAAAEERQRIAREVHDVVAHSLSITMLHLTAARHSLGDDTPPDEADVADAMDALREAEQLGRQAMTDIRRTVGLLDGGAGTQPAPGVADIATLVDGFRDAGMAVSYKLRGDPATVPESAGLSLYRIAQESLSNVAKHAPGSQVRATLDLAGDPPRLRVWNNLSDGAAPVRDGQGTGLHGMAERSELLGGRFRAGPDGGPHGGWSVEVELPARGHPAGDCSASALLSKAGLNRPDGDAVSKPALGGP